MNTKPILRYIPLALLLVMMALPGCYKDKGNYAYHQINDITITTVADTFHVTRLDTLRITPVIQAALTPDTGRLKYEWDAYLDPSFVVDTTAPESSKIVVLSTQRNLDIQVLLNAESSGPYDLDLKVTDTVTGVGYFKHLFLYVNSTLQNGWMLLEQKSGYSDISMITPNDTVFHGVFSAANPTAALPLSANQLQSFYINSGGMGALNFVLTTNGGYVLDHNTLKILMPYSQFFYGPPTVVQPGTVANPSYFTSLYTVNAGQVYSMNAMYGATLFGAAYLQADNLGSVIAPWVTGGYVYGGIFFDQANYRFLNDGSTTSLYPFPASASAGGGFDMNNVHKNMLTMQPGIGDPLDPNNVYAVFENINNDSCFLYSLNPYANVVPLWQQPILNSPGVQNSVGFLFSPTVQQMYYSSGSQLYVYDMAANTSRVVYQFASGENITALQLMNNVIVAATYTGSTQGGSVYYLPVAPTGDIQGNNYSQKFTGFDKIINMVYKQG